MTAEERRHLQRIIPGETSPLELFQERLRGSDHYPWKMCVACILLNRTQGQQVELVLWELFNKWPTPALLASASSTALEQHLRPLGLWRKRGAVLIQLSHTWNALEISGAKTETFSRILGLLPGIGAYAQDSWKIFVEGRLYDVFPTDLRLRAYLLWARTEVSKGN